VLAPQRSAGTLAALDWRLDAGLADPVTLRSDAAKLLATNAMADALPLFEALAHRDVAPLRMPLSAELALRVRFAEFT
jgi:hypothetical protein